MNRMAMVRQAILELGDAPAEELATFITERFGVTIDPMYLPIFRASIRDLENLTRIRQAAKMEKSAATT